MRLSHFLPILAAVFLVASTQIGVKLTLAWSELGQVRASVTKVDKRGYALAMRAAWLEEALLLANGSTLTCECGPTQLFLVYTPECWLI